MLVPRVSKMVFNQNHQLIVNKNRILQSNLYIENKYSFTNKFRDNAELVPKINKNDSKFNKSWLSKSVYNSQYGIIG